MPLLVNMQPAGKYLGEEYFRAGGLPAVMQELLRAKRIHADALTINGKTMGENVKRAEVQDADVIKAYAKPMKKAAGFLVLKGNLFDSAIMKTSVISDDFRRRFLSNPNDKNAFVGRAVVFEGPEDYHHRIEDPDAQDRRAHRAVRPRRRADRLSRLGGSGEHAAACRVDKKRHHVAALHRRWPAIGNIRLAVDPQCVAGSGGRRRARFAQDR